MRSKKKNFRFTPEDELVLSDLKTLYFKKYGREFTESELLRMSLRSAARTLVEEEKGKKT